MTVEHRRAQPKDPPLNPHPPRKRSPRRKTARSGTSEAFHWAWTWFRILRSRKVPDATRGTSGTPGATGTRVRHGDFSHLADYFRIADHPGATGLDTSVACALYDQVAPGQINFRLAPLKRANLAGTPSAVFLRNATPSVFHQRHIGRVLRSSCNSPGRRLASSRRREPSAGRYPPLWPGDLRNDGGSVAAAGADGSEA